MMKVAHRRGLTRKDMLKLSLLGGAALVLPLERAAKTVTIADRIPESRLPAPFRVRFAAPPVLRPVKRTRTTDFYQITMRRGVAEVIPGLRTPVFGYNGIAPGPTIHAMRGRRTVVRQINRGPRTTSVHLHGSDTLPQYDGYAEDVTRPGFYKDYHYPNDQNARTIWYHDHAIHHTAENGYDGLAAFYILHDRHELGLPIPHGKYDVPLVIRDAIFAKNGQMIFDDQEHSSLMGDVILANGRPWPVMKVERRKYRFRILNASISRGFDLALSTGEPLTVIGTDGGLMPRPVQTSNLRVGMAERYEVVIDFARYPVGTKVVLRNLGVKNSVDFDSTQQVMRFDVVSEARDRRNNSVPAVLYPNNPVMKLQESQAEHTHSLRFDRRHGLWSINGRTWNKNRVDMRCELDEIDIIELTNNSGGWNHPVHFHLIDFKILDRDGEPPFPYERGPKDVAYVGEGETVRFIAKFRPRKGKYMIHCHNLVHEDHDMMTQFEVGRGGPDPVDAAPPRPISRMRPL